MTVEEFMKYLLIVLALGVPLYGVIRFLRNKLPATAFRNFRSLQDLTSYYRAAMTTVNTQRWLVWFPLCFVLSSLALKSVIFLKQRAQVKMMGNYMNAHNAEKVAGFFYGGGMSAGKAFQSLLQTPRQLPYGYMGAIDGSILFLILFILCSLAFKVVTQKLRGFESPENSSNITLLEKIWRISFFLVIVQAALVIKSAMLMDRGGNIILIIFAGSSIVITALGILSLSLLSIIEGFLLFAVKDIIAQNKPEIRTSLSQALTVLRPLMLFNVLLAILAYIPSLLLLPNTVVSFLAPDNAPWRYSSMLPELADVFRYTYAVVTIFTFCIPFIVVLDDCDVTEAFKKNYNLIGHNLLKYLTFVGLGILLLFIPSLTADILRLFVPQFSILRLLIDMLMGAMTLLFAVIFYIASFNLVLKMKGDVTPS